MVDGGGLGARGAPGLVLGALLTGLTGDRGFQAGLARDIRSARRAELGFALLRRRQRQRLAGVLRAAATTPAGRPAAAAYLRAAEALVADGTGRGLAPAGALRDVPLLDKEAVRHGLRRLLVPAPGPVDVRVTSGTTGDVTQIARPRAAARQRAAVDRRLFDALGLPGFFTFTVVTPWRQGAVDTWGFHDWRVRMRRVGWAELGDSCRRGRWPGDLLVSSPAILEAVGGMLPPGVRVASAWEVPRPIRALFGLAEPGPPEAPAELYAAAEMTSPIAFRPPDCPRLHVNADAVLVEIVDRDDAVVPDGRAGDVVLTDLLNTSMPFIRYRIGDVAVLDTAARCSCGRITPTLLLLGRAGARHPGPRRVLAELAATPPVLAVEASPADLVIVGVGPDTVRAAHLASVRHGIEVTAREWPAGIGPMPPEGLVVSVADRYPLADWRSKTSGDVFAGLGSR